MKKSTVFRALITTTVSMIAVSVAQGATYEIDPAHTNARFAIDHFNTSTNVGGFYGLTGSLDFNPAAKTGSVSITIPVSSLQTGSEGFNNHLKSTDLFDADKYPTLQFESTKFNFVGNGKNRKVSSVDGKLTMLGQTHPVRLRADKFNCYQSPKLKKEVCGGDFSVTIDRTKWGMNFLVGSGMTKKVRIDIQIEAIKQD